MKVEVHRLAGGHVRGHDFGRLRPGGHGLVVQGVLPAGVGEGVPVDVVQIQVAPPAQQVAETHIGLAEGIVGIKLHVPPLLPGQEGGHVGAARRDADEIVKGNPLIQAGVKDPCAIHAPQAAAYVYHSNHV